MGDVFSYDEAVADAAHGDLQSVISGLQASLDDLSGFVTTGSVKDMRGQVRGALQK